MDLTFSMDKRHGAVARIGAWALLVGVTLAAYLPALNGGLLWDDDHHITSPDLQSAHGLWRIWFDVGATQQYYPLLHSLFWIEHRIWGDAVLGYHITSVILHATAAWLVIAIVRRLSLKGAWLAGFVFALHPVCVEAVAWISEQKSTFSAVFCLGAALLYLDFDETRRRSRYAFAAALFALALLSKTVTATLPAALLVILWWKRGRLGWKRDVLPLLPMFVLGGCGGVVTAWIERTSIGARGPDFALTLGQRLLLAGRAIWFYAGKLLWPGTLIFTYPRWTLDTREWWQWLFPAGVLGLTVALGLAARRHRGPLAGFLIFAGTLFPVLGFLNVYPFIFSFVADHFQYLASLGIIVPAAVGMTVAAERLSPGKAARIGASAAAILLGALFALTWRQSRMYRDSEVLYQATLARNPASWMAHNNLCSMLSARPDRRPEAIAHCEAALRLRPSYAEAHNNLGSLLAQTPDGLAAAIGEFRAAIQAKPEFADAHFNLANALARVPGRRPEAIVEYEAALRIRPAYLQARMNLGSVLLQMPGRLPDAIAQLQTVVRLHPDLAEAHNNLGTALAQVPGRLPEAIAEVRTALQADPHDAKAHNNLGTLLARIPGRLPEAIGEYRAAVRDNPNYAAGHYNLAVALANAGETSGAIAEFEAVLRIEPASAKAHYNLGVLLLRTEGRSTEALAHLDAALRIDPDPNLRMAVERLRGATPNLHAKDW